MTTPVEPAPCDWRFPPVEVADERGLVCVGGDLEPGTLLEAYRHGLFPMPLSRRHLGWWSPDPRAVLPLEALRVSRSLRKSCARYEIRIDTCFTDVVRACADPRRPHGWIDRRIVDAYTRLHRLGWCHSVEVFTSGGELAGGLYGVAIGGLFAGESMFHRHTDASKVALVALVELLASTGSRSAPAAPVVLDVQWLTPHLASLGAVDVARSSYLAALEPALAAPSPWPTGDAHPASMGG